MKSGKFILILKSSLENNIMRNNIFKSLLVLFLSLFILPLGNLYAKEEKGDSLSDKNLCYECHKGLKGKFKSVCPDWEKSVHSKKGTKCNICHGGNSSIFDAKRAKGKMYNFVGRPKKHQISKICGRIECHSGALAQFKSSPHYKSVQESGEPNCTSCHGFHDIQKTTINIMSEKACTGCHSSEYSKEIINSVLTIEKDLDNLQKSLDYLLEKEAAEVAEISLKVAETKLLFHQFVHTFSKDLMAFSEKIINLEIVALQDDLDKKTAVLKRIDLWYILTVLNIVIILSGFSIYFYWRLYRKKAKERFQKPTESV